MNVDPFAMFLLGARFTVLARAIAVRMLRPQL
jgi:hypothetical protein